MFVFHGDGVNGAGIRSSFKLEAASTEGAIFVYPDGLARRGASTTRPTAALQVIGQSDDLLNEGKKARDHWKRVKHCRATTSAYAPSPCLSYDGCDADRPEVYCEIPGLGHAIWDKGAQVAWEFIASK